MNLLRAIRIGCSALFVGAWVVIVGGIFLVGWLFPATPYAFPDPVENQAVYDPAGIITPGVEAALEAQIDDIEARSGAEVAIYAQVWPAADNETNLQAALDLMNQWGVGRAGFDDGLVILASMEDDLIHGTVSLWGGSGFTRAYLSKSDIQAVIDELIVPAARDQQLEAGLLLALDAVDAAITPGATSWLEFSRQLNAVIGIVLAPVALLVSIGVVSWKWRREGDDPEVLDSPSILMAGPPAEMTPALATVVRQGKATKHSLNTMLMELASTGRLAFHNLDRVREVKSDDDPNPLTDPSIEISDAPPTGRKLGLVESEAWRLIRRYANGLSILSRGDLWKLNDVLDPFKDALELQVVEIGWFTRKPSTLIGTWSWIGVAEMVAGGVSVFGGFFIPMSGLTLLGAALGLGGVVTWIIGQFMSQRTKNGALVDAMLKAYRRTLEKTLELARNMEEVVADETVRVLADTPDKAVVWGFALGLHDQVGEVLKRGLEEAATAGRSQYAYYPMWLGSSPSTFSGGDAGGAFGGGGSIFSGSGVPDIGGMFSAVGSIGSSPPSSSSSGGGGGFGGGGGGGGGGGSGSF